MQSEILEQNPQAEVAAYAVWLPFLGGKKDAIDTEILGDPRVVHYWDGDRLTSDWFGESVFGDDVGRRIAARCETPGLLLAVGALGPSILSCERDRPSRGRL